MGAARSADAAGAPFSVQPGKWGGWVGFQRRGLMGRTGRGLRRGGALRLLLLEGRAVMGQKKLLGMGADLNNGTRGDGRGNLLPVAAV